MLKLIAFLLLPLGAVAFVAGCGGEPEAEQDRPTIVVTVGMLADVVREVAGEQFDVQSLMGPGTDPHVYQASRGDAVALNDAAAIFYVGHHLEGTMTEKLEEIAGDKPVVAVAEAIDDASLIAVDEGDAFDPHVWMSVPLWSEVVTIVERELTELAPEGRSTFTANAERLRRQLEQLDEYAVRSLGSIPEDQRVLVTAHDAFGYLGRDYQIEVHGVQGISTEAEAGLQDVERLIDLIVERKIPAVFFESSVDPKNVRVLVEGSADRGHTVVQGGELFSDAMGPAGTYEGTYIGMIDHNVTTITRALGGEAPEGGLNGRLGAE